MIPRGKYRNKKEGESCTIICHSVIHMHIIIYHKPFNNDCDIYTDTFLPQLVFSIWGGANG